jgi:hypothetical protein
MDDLKTTLAQSGIDVSTLQVMHDAGMETLYLLTCSGSEAIALWQRLRALVDVTGYWPVVMGEQSDVEMHLDSIQNELDNNQKLTIREISALWQLERVPHSGRTCVPAEVLA